jgi:hypothetical protein
VSQPDDSDDTSDRDSVWTLTIEKPDGTVETRQLTVPRSDEPFNHDGFWKAVLVAPEDGRLYCVPLLAITCEMVEAPPRLFIWHDDTAVECKDVPGFVCAMGTEKDEATVCRDVARDNAEGVEAWRDAFAWARQRKGE